MVHRTREGASRSRMRPTLREPLTHRKTEAALDFRNVSLRTALMISLVGMVILPGLGTTLFAVPVYFSTLRSECGGAGFPGHGFV